MTALDLVPRPLLDPHGCPHIHVDARPGAALDKCAQCGASVRWVQTGFGGWRAVVADSDAPADSSGAR